MVSDSGASIAERLRRDLGRLTPNEKRAAQRLLADFPMAGLDTAARFGEAAGVSAPTILRMIAKLGFSSYGAFQDDLKAELAAQRETPLTKGMKVHPDDPLAGFAQAAIANLRATAENLPRNEFAAVATLLADPRYRLHFLGGRFTDAIADYMTAHLRVIRPDVRRVGGQPAAWLDQLLDIGRRDVVVLFDIRRYSDDLRDFAERAAAQGAIIVLVTDQWLSPISKVARRVLPAHVAVPSVWDSNAGLLMLVEALIAAVVERRGEEGRRRLEALEAIRSRP
ncbi:MurR/RpiR family transcriptional regulator [Kaistia dalseonensis]|uniref:DNA-binding MurR/RpiR family transcriptional regulator n=1 Tax=Kaistia dalseonensis TaxID=410840 RepID=A0ABU0H6A6_9HYPH|nr:MurR/RpiR family transcriptional regulator [Kaistia dalseonensis]MCX5495235.1 MurR/RpiR family transcriptional regulator [Kaistia dalseonensis]MDQ0437821.1 DNA-binding MurR/RpiR family transcriptional regulator [Kaistia dalseonensis]